MTRILGDIPTAGIVAHGYKIVQCSIAHSCLLTTLSEWRHLHSEWVLHLSSWVDGISV